MQPQIGKGCKPDHSASPACFSQPPTLQGKKDKDRQAPLLSVDAERNEWTLRPDLLAVIDRAVADSIPASKDEGKPLEGLAVRNAQVPCSMPPEIHTLVSDHALW